MWKTWKLPTCKNFHVCSVWVWQVLKLGIMRYWYNNYFNKYLFLIDRHGWWYLTEFMVYYTLNCVKCTNSHKIYANCFMFQTTEVSYGHFNFLIITHQVQAVRTASFIQSEASFTFTAGTSLASHWLAVNTWAAMAMYTTSEDGAEDCPEHVACE